MKSIELGVITEEKNRKGRMKGKHTNNTETDVFNIGTEINQITIFNLTKQVCISVPLIQLNNVQYYQN